MKNTNLPSNYYDGANQKLLNAIPHEATKILELGCANGKLGAIFKKMHPSAVWHGIDCVESAIEQASQVLDQTHLLDLDNATLDDLDRDYDTVVFGDLLEHVKDPTELLLKLSKHTKEDAKLVCCVPNMSHISVIHRLISGDVSYDPSGLLDQTHLRFFSPSSLFKIMLDAGWVPDLVDQYQSDLQDNPFTRKIVEAANIIGLPTSTAVKNLSLWQMIVVANKWKCESTANIPISVIVPVSRDWQFNLNLLRSPGLAEINAQIIPIQGASSAADAWEKGIQQAKHDWILMCHQDVYFPPGTGYAIQQELMEVHAKGVAGIPIGFAGMWQTESQLNYGGYIVDRRRVFDNPATWNAYSLDEVAVLLHKKSKFKIDHEFGWHLWATDLCQQAKEMTGKDVARITRIPIFHNSVGEYVVPPEFHASVRVMFSKYKELNEFTTLCGTYKRNNNG